MLFSDAGYSMLNAKYAAIKQLTIVTKFDDLMSGILSHMTKNSQLMSPTDTATYGKLL